MGFGKDLVVRFFYYNSYWRNENFVVINCGVILEIMIESELFGFEVGVFISV